LRPVKPSRASLPRCSVRPVEPDVEILSSSDNEEALKLLSPSLFRGLTSRPLEGDIQVPSSSSGSDLFEDWPEANDMAATVYVVLTTEASSSRASTTDASHDRWESHADSSST
jgi:hypothetical protein